MILLDTSILSRVFRRLHPGPQEEAVRAEIERLIARSTPMGLPAMVLQEALSGIRSEKQFAELEQKLLACFEILHPSTRDYLEAARLKNRCLTAGFNASGVDCLIAAVAVAGGHRLFAADQDFDAIAKHAPLKLHKMRQAGRPR